MTSHQEIGCRTNPLHAVPFPSGLEKAAQLFKALGDETRLKLLYLVKDQEVCVCELMATMGMPQGTLSHHLLLLHQAGLVTARKEGRWNYYQATPLAQGPLTVFEGKQDDC